MQTAIRNIGRGDAGMCQIDNTWADGTAEQRVLYQVSAGTQVRGIVVSLPR